MYIKSNILKDRASKKTPRKKQRENKQAESIFESPCSSKFNVHENEQGYFKCLNLRYILSTHYEKITLIK